jgi:hypothetical protein
VIVDVEATRAIRQAEVGAARTMLERTETCFSMKPAFLAADSAYGSAESLAWLVKQKTTTPHIPVFDKSNRTDGTFSRADFAFNPERDRYTCPAGKELVQFRRTYAIPRSGVTAEGTRLYRASKLDCDVCKLKAQCCPNALARKIPRDLHEDARDVARAHAATPEYVEACRRRKKVEILFARLKRILRLTPQGSEWRKRRVPACRDRPKPETTRPLKTSQHASGNNSPHNAAECGRRAAQKTLAYPSRNPTRFPSERILDGFFQRYLREADGSSRRLAVIAGSRPWVVREAAMRNRHRSSRCGIGRAAAIAARSDFRSREIRSGSAFAIVRFVEKILGRLLTSSLYGAAKT